MRDPILFGDFRMALHEGETRIYEDIQDYEAAKALFQVWRGSLLLGHLSGELSMAQVPRGWSWEEHLCFCLRFRMRACVRSSGSHCPRCMGMT